MIYHRLEMGGIETLIVRLANILAAEGIEVQIFARPGALEANLAKNVIVTHFDQYNEIWRRHFKSCANATIISFDPLSYLIMRRLQLKVFLSTGDRIRGHGGIFHPRSLFWSGDPLPVRFTIKLAFKLSGDHEFFFMSNAVKLSSKKGLRIRSQLSNRVIKLPLSLDEKPSWSPKNYDLLNIISVGRLAPFKAYNKKAPEIISKLLNNGINSKWDIWGDGEDKTFIINEISKLGINTKVSLHGSLDYSKIKETLIKADLFVGMGTAALEAASLGIPTICCIDEVEDLCYGYLHEAPGDIIGEQSEGFEYKDLFECISKFQEQSSEDRMALGILCREAAMFKSSGTSYQDITKAPIWPQSILKEAVSLVISAPYIFAVDSRKLRIAFKALRRVFK